MNGKIISLSILCCFVVIAVNGGPIWPKRFQVDFHEVLYKTSETIYQCKGRWYYDLTNQRVRFDHYQGQMDNFCQGQNLSVSDPTADCHLLFAPDTSMFVHYPNQKTCCRLCLPGIGCSPLRFDWIANATMQGTEEVEGKECKKYYEEGAVAHDYWFETIDKKPCRYFEQIPKQNPFIFHNLTFFPDTYSEDVLDDSIFMVPEYCHRDCPHPYPPPHRRSNAVP
ncbi:uncharacterized protein [Clytia hemisphaerica]|uniref:Uncharacterized protein n=1 Tax=Clytia hemisphaerica TaxID=252671 RepID=A0A7M5WUZ2_9CNID